MTAKRDIESLDDIKLLVDTFYAKVQKDPLIGPIFESVVKGHWDTHLDKMYRFWQTILLDEVAYSGSPFLAHAPLPIHKEHFQAWLILWKETLNEQYEGQKATDALWRAERMAEMFEYKLDYMRNNNTKPLI